MHKEHITSADQIKAISGILAEEAETHINYDRSSTLAFLYTTDNKVVTKMKRIFNNSSDYICEAMVREDGSIISYIFSFPKTYLTFRRGKRNMSDEARKQASERIKQMWINKKQRDDQ